MLPYILITGPQRLVGRRVNVELEDENEGYPGWFIGSILRYLCGSYKITFHGNDDSHNIWLAKEDVPSATLNCCKRWSKVLYCNCQDNEFFNSRLILMGCFGDLFMITIHSKLNFGSDSYKKGTRGGIFLYIQNSLKVHLTPNFFFR